MSDIGCGTLDLPKDTEFEIASGKKPDCLHWWFTSSEIPGERTLSNEQMQPDKDCSLDRTENIHQKYPWNAPGTAHVISPCGTMGGHPFGCSGFLMGEFMIAENFGDICPCDGEGLGGYYESFGCGSFAYGGLAHQYDWPHAPITKWKAGSIEEVAQWQTLGRHAGGYSYRLCKIPAEGISGLTEECFQNGHLDFIDDKQWVYYGNEYIESGTKVEINSTRINEGTFPPRSTWTAVPFSYTKYTQLYENFADPGTYGHVIDKVKVPESLEPGDYVLSWRLDSKCTAEVFSSCANIEITK